MQQTEIERTYLAKYLPEDLNNFPSAEVLDIYIPKKSEHPKLRIRKRGERYEMTQKTPQEGEGAAFHNEETITLTEGEFNELATLEGKRVRKKRVKYVYQGANGEIDIFLDDLEGLVLVDFEFDNKRDYENFKMPDFCLTDITEEKAIAGGLLAGKKYQDIEDILLKYGYKKLTT